MKVRKFSAGSAIQATLGVVGVGMVLGIAFEDLAAGITIGVIMGTVVGSVLALRAYRTRKNQS